MNTHDIELPPLPGGIELQKVSMRGPVGVGEAMQQYARAAVEADRQQRGEPDDQMFRDLEARVQSLDAECARLEAENDKLKSAQPAKPSNSGELEPAAQAQPAGAGSLEVLRRVWQPHTQSNVDRMSEEDIAEEIASEVNRRWADEQPAARAAKEK